ncbi:YigZ family protein [Thalassotalea insulae]|uniref:YigZ family protein n=1 Tax=Thalassotalea insulae TaxID=2056778 RepID=A0ABQ6GRF9_9GAMM|nr:YigZ family protein [Thalassotalea insulae]GLX78507.1 YigZ family protein [Thalassotalea insulae]
MTSSYSIAANEVIDETVVTRSRFICYLAPCQSKEAAKLFLKQIQQLHPQASHHCYAFVCAHPLDSQSYGFSDDGEPSGTAGRPMLAVLQGSGIGEIIAVVVRYFGGTKLGTGGLQRAYGASVRQALVHLQTKTKIPMVEKTLACQYTQVNDVLHLIEKNGGQIIEQNFQTDVNLSLLIPADNIQQIKTQLQTLSSGQLALKSKEP